MEASKNFPRRLIPIIVIGACAALIAGIFLGIGYLLRIFFIRFVCWIWRVDGVLLYSEHPAWKEWSEELANNSHLTPLVWNERKTWSVSPAILLLYATLRNHSSLKKDQSNPRKEMYPSAVIFGRSFFPTTIRFAHAWQRLFKGDDSTLKAQMILLRDKMDKVSSG